MAKIYDADVNKYKIRHWLWNTTETKAFNGYARPKAIYQELRGKHIREQCKPNIQIMGTCSDYY